MIVGQLSVLSAPRITGLETSVREQGRSLSMNQQVNGCMLALEGLHKVWQKVGWPKTRIYE